MALSQREYSRAELARKLAGHGTTEAIDAVLAQLETEGLLSDARASAAFLRSQGARFGVAKLRQTLRAKGIDSELAEASLGELDDEMARARAIWARKFGNAPTDAREWARQARFLQSRGFAVDLIRRLLKDPTE